MAQNMNNKETLNELTLYLCDKEEIGDFLMPEIHYSIRLSANNGWSEKKRLTFSKKEIADIICSGKNLMISLYNKFGINNFDAQIGLPRGPYYSFIEEKEINNALLSMF